MAKQYLEAGKITGPHGIKGDIKITPWCNGCDFLCDFDGFYFDEGKNFIKIKFAKVHKNIVITHFDGIETIEQAEKLRGKIIYINKNKVNLPEDEYFIQDIIGLDVFDKNTNELYGKITEVFKTGANDVYQVTSKENKNYLIPVIKEVVIDIDIPGGKINIVPIKGIFGDED